MVVVDPFDLFVGHDGGVEEVDVEWEECHHFEVEEAAEFGLFPRLGDDEVFAAYAVSVGEIEAGLVACDHTGLQRSGVLVEAYVLRPFVAVDEESDSVSGAVIVSFSFGPEELSGEHVKLCAACAFREYGPGQGDVSFHDEGEIVALRGSGFAQSDGACDVGGAESVLAAAVDEQKSLSGDGGIGLGSAS